MVKKLAILILITAMMVTLGCTGTDQTPAVQPAPTSPAATTSPTGDAGITISPIVSPSLTEGMTAENESMPELDLPLPPDLADL